MKVFVTGGTGFVGRELVKQLLEAGNRVRCLVRPGSEQKLSGLSGVEFHPGDATRPESLVRGLENCTAVIHLVGIIREFPRRGISFQKLHVEATRNLVAAAEAQGVKRFLQMSANGAREGAVTPYHRSKWQGEETVRASALDWTIFRPSLIYGPNDQFVNLLAALLRSLPVVPVMGDGNYRLQPVSVSDVAAGFVRALSGAESCGQSYQCGGPEAYSYNQLLDLIGQTLGKRKVRKLHQPLALMKPAVALLEHFPPFPMTSCQLQMLLEGNCCDPADWQRTFGIEATPFAEGISYLKRNQNPNKG